MEEHHIEEVTQIQQQNQEHIEEMNRQQEQAKKQLITEAQVKQQELHVNTSLSIVLKNISKGTQIWRRLLGTAFVSKQILIRISQSIS